MDTFKPCEQESELIEIVPDRQVLKYILTPSDGPFIQLGQIATLNTEVHADDGSILATSQTMEFECRNLTTEASGFGMAKLLQSMKVGEIAWAFISQRYNDFKETPWGNLWLLVEVISIREQDALSADLPYISETSINDGILKRVLTAGFGTSMPPNARVNILYSIRSDAGVELQGKTNQVMNVFRHSDGYFHKPIVLTLRTMQEGEEVLIRADPGYHDIQSHSSSPVWFYMFLGNIEIIDDFYEPRGQSYIREEMLKEDGGVFKRVIKEGEGEVFPDNSIIWLTIEGRLEDGYCFQRPKKHKIDLGLNDSRIYSDSWYLALKSMRRKEISWVYSEKSYHLYEHNEPVWFRFVVDEYKIPQEIRPISSMSFEERLLSAAESIQEGNRMFGSAKYGESLKAYNKASSLMLFKQEEFSTAEESFRNNVKSLRVRCWLNSAQALLKMYDIVIKPEDKIKKANEAIERCNDVLKLEPENEKALFRKANGYMLKKEYEKSFPLLRECIRLRPNDKTVREQYNNCLKCIQQTEKDQKKKYVKMFAKLEKEFEEEVKLKTEEDKKLMRDLNRESHRTSTKTSKINSQIVTPNPQAMELNQDDIISRLMTSGLVTGPQDDLDGYLIFDDE